MSTLQQLFYGVRSERQLMDDLRQTTWGGTHDVYQASRKIAARRSVQSLHGCAVPHEEVTALLSDKHFSGNSTLVEAMVGHKIFKPNDDTDSDGEHFHGYTLVRIPTLLPRTGSWDPNTRPHQAPMS